MTAVALGKDLEDATKTLDMLRQMDAKLLSSEVGVKFGSFEKVRAHGLVAIGYLVNRADDLGQAKKLMNAELVQEWGQSHRNARAYVDFGCRIIAWSILTTWFIAARVSYSAARVLLPYLTEENEAELVELASQLTVADLQVALSGQEGSDRRRPTEYMRYRVLPSGNVVGSFELGGANGALLLATLKKTELINAGIANLDEVPAGMDQEELAGYITEQVIAAEKEDLPEVCDSENIIPDEAHNELAIPEETGIIEIEKLPFTRYGPPQYRPLLAAFISMLRLAGMAPASRAVARAPGANVKIIIGHDQLARIPGQWGLRNSELIDPIINGAIQTFITDDEGVVTETGRNTRYIPDVVAEAILSTWNHRCATPGCKHERFLEFNHINPFAEGGPTEIRNLIPLCSGCHALVTAGKITIFIDEKDPRILHFRFPGGRNFQSYRRGLPRRSEQQEIYFEGPVPLGDEERLVQWDLSQLNFDDEVIDAPVE